MAVNASVVGSLWYSVRRNGGATARTKYGTIFGKAARSPPCREYRALTLDWIGETGRSGENKVRLRVHRVLALWLWLEYGIAVVARQRRHTTTV
jgi:hypothetical protein